MVLDAAEDILDFLLELVLEVRGVKFGFAIRLFCAKSTTALPQKRSVFAFSKTIEARAQQEILSLAGIACVEATSRLSTLASCTVG